MQIVINSANIATFKCVVTFNLLQRNVVFDFSQSSYVGGGAANVKGISMSLLDQTGVELANGGINFTTPQIPGPITSGNNIYILDLSSVSFPFLFQNYKITVAIRDQNNAIYTTIPVYKTLCEPTDFTDSGYVPGIFQITPDCINSVLTVKELTALVYNNLTPYLVTKTGVLNYPTGTISALNFSNTPFSNNVVYTGAYSINCTTVATYALLDDVYVNVSYVTINDSFPVTCANKISDLMCCIVGVQTIAVKHCEDAKGQNAKQQLYDILPYVVTGLAKEVSGQDATFEAEFIRKSLNCDCGSSSLRQSEFTPVNPAVTSIVLNGIGGTSIPAPITTGNTKTYNIGSNVYQVVKGNTGDLAFTISTNTSILNTVQYLITINYDMFAGSILNAISADPTLINQLNSLVNVTGFSTVGLDGLCVIDLTKVTYAIFVEVNSSMLITNIVINGLTYNAPSNLFANNAAPINTWLNSLSLGIFNASITTTVLTILSVNNTNTVSTMTFTNPNVTQQFLANNATLTQVLQSVFNYLCGITALQVALGNNLSLCTFDYNGVVVTTNYAGTQGGYNSGVSSAICNIVARMNTLTGITCAKIQSIFQDNTTGTFGPSDRVYGTIGGGCASLTDKQIANVVIAAVQKYSDVKANFCAISCVAPGTCPDVSAINLSMSGPNIGVYGLTWVGPNPAATQTVTVKYRVTGTTTWTVATSGLLISPTGAIQGTSPFLITGPLATGTSYDVQVINNCGGIGAINQITTPTGSIYSGSFLLGSVIYSVCGTGAVTLYSSSPFGSGVTMFTDPGLTTPATGHLFIVSISTNHIFNMNSSTAVVGSDTGSTCTAGTPANYQLGNNPGTICSAGTTVLYTNGAFAVGQILYTDSALTNPQTGFSYVVQTSTGTIYNLNSSTGAVGAATGSVCSQLVSIVNQTDGAISGETGIVGFTSQPVPPRLTVTGTHSGFTGSIGITLSSGSSSTTNMFLTVNGIFLQSLGPISPGDTTTRTFAIRTYAPTDTILIQWT